MRSLCNTHEKNQKSLQKFLMENVKGVPSYRQRGVELKSVLAKQSLDIIDYDESVT
jgi:hypothetical protein